MDEEEKRLKDRSIQPTAMRIRVLQAFLEVGQGLTLRELEQYLHTADKSTIFRTLKTFESSKLIHRISDGTGSEKYALCYESCECQPEDVHYHFTCEGCNTTFCLENFKLNELKLPKGFTFSNANLVIKGTCSECN